MAAKRIIYFCFLLQPTKAPDKYQQVITEEQGKGCVKLSVWWSYFRAGNSIAGLIYILFVLLISQAICSGADYFVNVYTKIMFMEKLQEPDAAHISENRCLIIYALLVASAVFVSF